MSVLGSTHGRLVHQRRVTVLAAHLARLLPPSASVLDIGCGDGKLAALLLEQRPDLSIRGVDVLVRPDPAIQVEEFDGTHLPYPDGSFDHALLIDVLHHTDDPRVLLREAARVVRRAVVIKDHLRDQWLAGPTLRLMDWVGNARHGVRLPYNYLSTPEWKAAFGALGLSVERWDTRIGLYPWPASRVFGRELHVIAQVAPGAAA